MTRQEALELLKGGSEGIAKWNAWRDEQSDPNSPVRNPYDEDFEFISLAPDLLEPALIEADLAGVDLTGVNLTRANLAQANLTGANLARANLTGANLSEANLARANLTGVNLTEADLSRGNLTGANLTEAKPTESNPPDEAIDEIRLTVANLTRANLILADLTSADLTRAGLIGATLTGAKLTDTDLTSAYLVGAKLRGTDLTRTKLRGTNLSKADLTRAKFTWVDLTGADLTGADLTWADLAGTKLRGADLRDAKLHGTNLSGTELQEANLRGAILIGVNFTETDLIGVNLDGCDGRYADFSHTTYTSSTWTSDLVARLFTWQKVRSVGGLQILTKASYTMIALVPILAGVWQGVKVWAIQSKQEVSQAVKDLDHATERRRAAASEPVAQELDQVRAVTHKLQALIDRGDFDHKLPSAWAMAFFAALFVVAGHFVYQVRCPELVAQKTPDKFADEQLAGFSATGDDRNDRLVRATNALKELAETEPTRRHRNLVRRHGRVVWLPSNREFFEMPRDLTSEGGAAKLSPISGGPELMRVVIEEGARAEYELSALRDRPSAVVAFLLYAAAGALIVWLVLSQSWSVAKSAGWVG